MSRKRLRQLGIAVGAAGDVNGDGYDDVIVGAWEADPNGSKSGSSYVIFGQATGFAPTFDLSTLNGSNGFRLDGEAKDDQTGVAVSGAGEELRREQYDDLVARAGLQPTVLPL